MNDARGDPTDGEEPTTLQTEAWGGMAGEGKKARGHSPETAARPSQTESDFGRLISPLICKACKAGKPEAQKASSKGTKKKGKQNTTTKKREQKTRGPSRGNKRPEAQKTKH